MLCDQLKNADSYRALSDSIAAALDVLRSYNPAKFQPGRLDLDGETMYLMQLEYPTKSTDGALLEAHRQYIDVMYMLEGEEIIRFKPADELRFVCRPYDFSDDTMLAALDEDAGTLLLRAGQFAIFFPQDAHCPGCMVHAAKLVRRLVVKVRTDF